MKKKAFDPGEPRVEYEDLEKLRRWPGNPKDHDLGFLGEAFKENGFAELPIIDEGTGRMVAGHGRLEKLTEMRAAGQPPPERVRVEGKKWLIPVVRGMTLRAPGKHVLASNRGVELGGWDSKLLAQMLTKMGDEKLIGTGFSAEDVVKFAALAKGPQSPAEFPSVGETLGTDYCCPKCSYAWSGNPKPGPAADAEAAAK